MNRRPTAAEVRILDLCKEHDIYLHHTWYTEAGKRTRCRDGVYRLWCTKVRHWEGRATFAVIDRLIKNGLADAILLRTHAEYLEEAKHCTIFGNKIGLHGLHEPYVDALLEQCAKLYAEFVVYFNHPSKGYGKDAPAWPDCTGHTSEEVSQVVGNVLTVLDWTESRIVDFYQAYLSKEVKQ